jgi:hypothetical protein
MAQETLKLVITADNADALAKIKQFSESLGAQTRQFEQNKKATGDATNALTNFSRLAEDSAYGLRGAANNINPFIESFKRLKDETGSTKQAFLSMAQGLLGPAGILVAVSTISTVLISYADRQAKAKKESEELAKADDSGAEALKKKKQAIDSIYESSAKEAAQVSTLVAIINNETESRKRKNQALEQLQKIAPDIFDGLKLEGNAVNGLNTAYDKYINNINTVIGLKIKQGELELLTEKILKLQGVTLTQEEKLIKNIGDAYLKKRIETASDNESRKIAQDLLEKQTKKDAELNHLLELRKSLLKDITELGKGQKIVGGGEGNNEDKKDPYIEATKDFNNAVQTNLELLNVAKISQKSYFDNYLDIVKGYVNKLKGIDTEEARKKILELTPKELISTRPDYYDPELEAKAAAMDKFDTNKGLLALFGKDFGIGNDKEQSNQSFESGKRKLDEFFKDNKKNFEDATKQAKQFAETLASGTTNAVRSMWEAMKKGENILDALGNAFLNLAEDIAFAILKAQILAALETALNIGGAAATGGASAASSGGGILKILANLFGGGMAEGGIVTGPTLTMVGEGNEHEAVMPLSKLSGFLNTSFNAGSMSSRGGANGQFVLKGNDLVLALQRSNSNLNLRRGI